MLNLFSGFGKRTDDTDSLEQDALHMGFAEVRIRRFPSPPISTDSRFILIELDERGVWLPLGRNAFESLKTLENLSDALDAECTCDPGFTCYVCDLSPEPRLSIDAMIEVELQLRGELQVKKLKRKTVLDIEVMVH